MRLVPDWRDWWRWRNTRANGVGLVLSTAASALAKASAVGALGGVLPVWIVMAGFGLVFILAFIGRITLQRKKHPPHPTVPANLS